MGSLAMARTARRGVQPARPRHEQFDAVADQRPMAEPEQQTLAEIERGPIAREASMARYAR